MSDESPHSDEPTDVSSEDERSRALAEVLRHEEEREQARLRASRVMQKQQQRGLGVRHGVFLLALAATLYVWIGAPSWARVDSPPPPTAAHREASLRLAIYLQAQRVEMYRERTGELPERLAQTGPPLPGIRYTRTPRGTYHLEGQNDTLALFYSSSSLTPLSEFLGDGEQLAVSDDGGEG